MALDEVAAKAVADLHGAFEVDEGAGGEIAEAGDAEGLGEEVEGEGGGGEIDGGDSKAAAVDGDAVAEGDLRGEGGRMEEEAGALAFFFEGEDGGGGFDEAGEHGVMNGGLGIFEMAATAFVEKGEEEEDEACDEGEAAPEGGPWNITAVGFFAIGEPETAAEKACEVADAAREESKEGLGACALDGWDAVFEVDLSGDEVESVGESVEDNACDDPCGSAEHEDEVAEEAEGDAGEEDPFEPEAGHQVCEDDHDEDFGDLTEGHDAGGTRDAEFFEVADAVGVKSREGHGVECGGDEDYAVIGIAEEVEGVEAEDLFPAAMTTRVWGRGDWQGAGESGDDEPETGGDVAAEDAGVGVEDVADEPTAGHPADGGPGADGAELATGLAELGEDDGGTQAPHGGGNERHGEGAGENGGVAPTGFDGPAYESEEKAGSEAEPAEDEGGGDALVCESADDEGGDEGADAAGGEDPGEEVAFLEG